jgi:hypothetical protein
MIALILCWMAVTDSPPSPAQPRVSLLEQARGVTGPEPAPAGPTPLWRDERTWAVGLVAVAVAAALFIGRRRPAPPEPEPPLAVWAAAQLDRLAGVSPNADALARLLRVYLVRRHQLPAAGATTEEVVAGLGAADVAPVHSSYGRDARGTRDGGTWRLLLEQCDAARFSKTGMSHDEWSNAIAEAHRLTAETLPVGEVTGSTPNGPMSEKA